MAQNVLEWVDNSTDETAFLIERKAEACALNALTFVQIATVGPNVVTYTDIAVTEGVTYAYRLRAQNANGASGYTNCADRLVPDVTPPVVSLTSPLSGAVVVGSILLAASATDNVAVASVQFLLDGVNLGAPDTIAPYTLVWNSAGVPNGAHTLGAIATDTSGNQATAAPITVTVANGVTATLPVRPFVGA